MSAFGGKRKVSAYDPKRTLHRGKRMTGGMCVDGLRSSGGYQDSQYEKQTHRAEDNDLLNNASIETPHLLLLQSYNPYCE